MLSKKVRVGESRFGKGLFATELILENEGVLMFQGSARKFEEFSLLSQDINDHAVQIAEDTWIEVIDDSRYINHSCNPNCGIVMRRHVVAMRPILEGEELTFDYAMTENCPRDTWNLACLCGAPSCREIVRGYDSLPQKTKLKYMGYTSDWLWLKNLHLFIDPKTHLPYTPDKIADMIR